VKTRLMMQRGLTIGLCLWLCSLAWRSVDAQNSIGRFALLVVSGTATINQPAGAGANVLDVRSAADDLLAAGGVRVSRADGSYFILNANDNGASGVGVLQSGDLTDYRHIRLAPFGGGISVGDGTAFLKVLSASLAWDPANLQVDDGFDSVTLTMTGVTTTSPCFAAFSAALGTSVILSARYDTTNTVRAILVNTNTGLAYDPGAGTVRVTCFVY
jgi:hypothetical protein